MKAGSVFDNFVISDDIQGALKEAKQIVEDRVEAEKKMKEELDAAKKAEEPEEDERLASLLLCNFHQGVKIAITLGSIAIKDVRHESENTDHGTLALFIVD